MMNIFMLEDKNRGEGAGRKKDSVEQETRRGKENNCVKGNEKKKVGLTNISQLKNPPFTNCPGLPRQR